MDNTGWIRRLLSSCSEHRTAVGLSLAGAALASGAAALAPLLLRNVVDTIGKAGTTKLAPWLVALVGVGVVRFGFAFVRRYFAAKVAYGIDFDLRTAIFASLQRLDGRQQDRLRTGQVVSRAISDVGTVEGFLSAIPLLGGNLLLFLASLAIMLVLSPLLTVVALAMLPLMAVFTRHAAKRLFPAFWDWSHQSGEVANVVESAVSGVRVVKGFGQEHRELERLEGAAGRLFASGIRRAGMTARYFPFFGVLPLLGQVAVLALGGWLALRGSISLGTFVAFATYVGALIGPVTFFVVMIQQAQGLKASLIRIYEVIDTEPDLVDAPDAVEAPDVPATVELSGVTFAYDEAQDPVLRDVSLRVEPGQTLALVGGTGSGKSTVALLLARFYDPQDGTVSVAGRDVRTLTLASLRSRIGMVFEDSFLFSDTVYANIAFGRPGATPEQVHTAARLVEADAFIRELSDGYDTVVGERGLTLSGGQRQRIALARALLADPRVLVLDDATSAVDAGVEAEIHAALRTAISSRHGRTTILIAHRRSTLRLADRIAVLRHGEVIDVGTHEELTARCAHYRLLLAGHEEPDESVGHGEDLTRELWPQPSEPDASAGDGLFGGGLPPEQAEMVAGLPAATATPTLDPDDVRAPEPRFGLRRFGQPFGRLLLLGLALNLLIAGTGLSQPWLTRSAIDNGVLREAPGVLFAMAGIALGVVALSWLLGVVSMLVAGRTGETMLYWLRVKAYAHLQRLGMDFYEQERGGQLMTRMTTDIVSVTTFVQTSLQQFVVAVVSFVGTMGLMLALDAGLTLGVLAIVPFFVVGAFVFQRFSSRAYEVGRERLSDVNADFQENVAGLRVTQAYGRSAYNRERYREHAGAYVSAQMRAQRYVAVFFSLIEFAEAPTAAIVLGLGAGQVAGGTLSSGTLIAFLLYITMLFGPLQQFSQLVDGYQRAKVGLGRLRTLFQTPTSTPPASNPAPVSALKGSIAFQGVRFSYDEAAERSKSALRDIDLHISPGETVAVVGETGAGKSTLMKLVARFYDPTEGAVLVDDMDLRTLDLTAYRHRLGLVPQEAHLFAGTVRDAIAYGRPDATDLEVERAAREVGAHEMIARLPRGYRSSIGERGGELSAGQRQLLALARAQLVDPDILLLDEATAALDLATESAVTRATERLSRRRTTLVIAHRLTTAQQADRIVVVHGGRIVEAGTHETLLASGGRYSDLWSAFTGVRRPE